jgi:ATP-dependent helicase/nuclease subunit A
MAVPADFSIRERVLDPAESFIVQAPAGSGKTSLLTQRYLALLGRVNKPEEILAITFTRKAAAEMRERIIGALQCAADAQPAIEPYEKQTLLLAQAALARDQQQDWDILTRPERLKINTIDGFCSQMVRQMPWLSGVGAPLNTTEQPDSLYLASAQASVVSLTYSNGRFNDSLKAVLRAQDNNVDRVVKLISAMLARRDQWLRHVFDGELGDGREELAHAWREVIDEQIQEASGKLEQSFVEKAIILGAAAAERLPEDKRESEIANLLGVERLPEKGDAAIRVWRGLAALLLTGGKPRKAANVNLGFPVGKEFADAKKEVKQLFDELAGDERAVEALNKLSELPDKEFDEQQWMQLQALADVLKLAAAELKLQFIANGVVDFTEVSQRASHALGCIDEPSELALKLDYALTHILVDEFQDTSHSQFELLERLMSGWQVDSGKTLFFVGDPMQSIYRFREADVGLFLRVIDKGIGDIKPVYCQLSANFRSDPTLINWFNRVFKQSMPADSNIALGAVSYSDSTAGRELFDSSGVSIRVCENQVAEAEQVVDAIKECIQRGDEKIAVLVRSKAHLAEILPKLRLHNIPYRGVDIDPLQHQSVLIDLRLITIAIIEPEDRIACLGLLRSPLVGLSLADIKALVQTNYKGNMWECLNDQSRISALDKYARTRLSRLTSLMTDAMSMRKMYSVQPIVEYVWHNLGGLHMTGGVSSSDIDVYWQLLDQLGSNGELSIAELGLRIERLAATETSQNDDIQVELMTIHKSKGLQFDSVILPGLTRKTRSDDRAFLMWSEQLIRSSGKNRLLLAPLAGMETDAHYAYLSGQQKLRSKYELQRLMYVACTRAKQHLYLTAELQSDKNGETYQPPSGDKPLHHLWSALENEFQSSDMNRAVLPHAEDNEIKLTYMADSFEIPTSVPMPWQQSIDGAVEAGSVEYDWASDSARLVGQWLHNWLQIAPGPSALQNIPSRNKLSSELATLGVIKSELDQAVDRILKAFSAMQSDSKLHWILDQDNMAHNEYDLSFVGSNGIERVRIDRTFVENGVRWIIDYKSGQHLSHDLNNWLDQEQLRYASQLNRYAEVLSKKQAMQTRLGIYFPMHAAWREWEYTQGIPSDSVR